jgi:hypothetical protein
MSKRATNWLLGAAGLAVLIGLPILGNWARRDAQPRCALDGARIAPLFRIRVVDGQGQWHLFCCIDCAELWLKRQTEKPRAIFVTDEVNGQDIAVETAHFVRSLVAAPTGNGGRVHAFGQVADAERHAQAFHGTILTDRAKPFSEVR